MVASDTDSVYLRLCNLVDKEPDEDAQDDSLVQGTACHVDGLVVDSVDLLHALQVVLLGGSVGDGPETEIVHVAKHGPVVLEGDAEAFLLQLLVLVLVLGHSNVVCVRNGLTQVLPCWLHVRQLVHLCF